MLAELAAANAAFAIIRQTIVNGKEISDAGKAVGEFVNAKDTLEKKANRKKNSVFSKLAGSTGHDLEEFMALEKIKTQEEQLKQFMIYTGRPGLWQDWIKFQAKQRRARQIARMQAARRRQELIELFGYTSLFLLIVFVAASIFYGVYTLKN